MSAQQLRAEVREQAEREAQLIRREARAEGDRIIDDARVELRRIATEIEGLERARRAYLAQFRAMVARQLAELDAIPDLASARPVGASSLYQSRGSGARPRPMSSRRRPSRRRHPRRQERLLPTELTVRVCQLRRRRG